MTERNSRNSQDGRITWHTFSSNSTTNDSDSVLTYQSFERIMARMAETGWSTRESSFFTSQRSFTTWSGVFSGKIRGSETIKEKTAFDILVDMI